VKVKFSMVGEMWCFVVESRDEKASLMKLKSICEAVS
jgi:hypothetical protein